MADGDSDEGELRGERVTGTDLFVALVTNDGLRAVVTELTQRGPLRWQDYIEVSDDDGSYA